MDRGTGWEASFSSLLVPGGAYGWAGGLEVQHQLDGGHVVVGGRGVVVVVVEELLVVGA